MRKPTASVPTASSFRCFTEFVATCGANCCGRATGYGSMCPTESSGTPISCGGWQSAPPTCYFWRATCFEDKATDIASGWRRRGAVCRVCGPSLESGNAAYGPLLRAEPPSFHHDEHVSRARPTSLFLVRNLLSDERAAIGKPEIRDFFVQSRPQPS